MFSQATDIKVNINRKVPGAFEPLLKELCVDLGEDIDGNGRPKAREGACDGAPEIASHVRDGAATTLSPDRDIIMPLSYAQILLIEILR